MRVIITTYLPADGVRDIIYQKSIAYYKALFPADVKLYIVENGPPRLTCLNNTDIPVLYTNNYTGTVHKGCKELADIIAAIDFFEIPDGELVIKITGQYIIHPDTFTPPLVDDVIPFWRAVRNAMEGAAVDCILSYGSYYAPSRVPMNDCITVVIGMRAQYIQQINAVEQGPIEWEWARVALTIPSDRVQRVCYTFDIPRG